MTPPPNCTADGLTGDNQLMCQYALAMFPPGSAQSCGNSAYWDTTSSACVQYTSQSIPVAGMIGATIDTGNTAWMLAASALVMIMTPGVGFFYAGLAGEESAGNTILMSFATMCLVTVQWYLFGYSFAFGPGNGGFGSFDWACLLNVGLAPSAVYGVGIPHIIYAAFQCMFAQITPALISGAVIGRMKFSTWLIFVFIWATCVYDALAHWLWSFTLDANYNIVPLGWLGKLGAVDFAGGTVIHISSGFAALAAAIVLGPRHKTDEPMKPHNVPMVVMGATFLWFGWFGFNAGSAAAANAVASQAFWNTHLATATASLSWMACEYVESRKMTAVGASVGAVAGLVAITPACGWVGTYAAFIIGLLVSPGCYGAAKLKAKYGPDDTLDSFAVHGVGGAIGAILTGLFATQTVNTVNGAFYGSGVQLGYQIAAVLVSSCFSFVCTLVLMLVLKYTVGLRVTAEAEAAGLDKSEHGGESYHG